MNRYFHLAFSITIAFTSYAEAQLLTVDGNRDVQDANDVNGIPAFFWDTSGQVLSNNWSGMNYPAPLETGTASQVLELSLDGIGFFDASRSSLLVNGHVRFADHDPLNEILRFGSASVDTVTLWNDAINMNIPGTTFHPGGNPDFVPFILTVVDLVPYVDPMDPVTGTPQLDMPVDYFDGDNFADFDGIYLDSFELFAVGTGDANGDGELNNLDIASFVLALTNLPAYQAMFPNVDPDVVLDMNGDGGFDNLDIAVFVSALTGGEK